ncbi:ovoinhibitor-like isoform X4 [Engystomops pustulosus]|uniref:ovoinhibitor-like isoform X4 n=1 Tax=Engystomops pustulosus TaxID=76066 RepID=UPI003AFAAAAF
MKSIEVVVFAFAALTSFTGIMCHPIDQEIEPNCELYKPFPGIGLACDRMSKPVCGTNGKTYQNECLLCADILKLKLEIKIKYRTKCNDQSHEDGCQGYGDICTSDYSPVCGSDAVTYANKCSFCYAKKRNADLIFVSDGTCKEKSHEDVCQGYGDICTRDYSPVCGSDAVTYANKCSFCYAKKRNADLIFVSDGECKEKSHEDGCQGYGDICTRDYSPVCGSDAVTYANKCSFCYAKKRNAELVFVSDGKCKEKSHEDGCQGYGDICTSDYSPVCGSDAVTYANKCSFCYAKKRNADLIFVSDGECKEKSHEDGCQGYGDICTTDYSPVCGSDAVTYANKCSFCYAKKRNADLVFVSDGKCKEKSHEDGCQGYGDICTRDYSPVCGSDAVTYANKCSFCYAKKRNADLIFVSDGECKEK